MRRERTVLAIFGLAQFVVAAILAEHSTAAAIVFAAIGVMALDSARRSPGPPRRAKARAKAR